MELVEKQIRVVHAIVKKRRLTEALLGSLLYLRLPAATYTLIPTSQVTPHVSSINDFPRGQIYLVEHDFWGYSKLSPLNYSPCLVIMYSYGNLSWCFCWNLNFVPLFIILNSVFPVRLQVPSGQRLTLCLSEFIMEEAWFWISGIWVLVSIWQLTGIVTTTSQQFNVLSFKIFNIKMWCLDLVSFTVPLNSKVQGVYHTALNSVCRTVP